ncbi:MAG: NDP-sugar synthase [Nitrospinae bacterium]|nr:NDP-sugar synthase [Nitrospinota bacterium]
MQALVLSAGLGTRLLPITNFFPKPLLPISYETPLLRFIIQNLKHHSIKNININCFHKKEQFIEFKNKFYLHDDNVSLIIEEELLNTAGSLIHAKQYLTDATFWVCNGDIFVKPNFHEIMKQHREKKGIANLLLGKLGKKKVTPVEMNKDGLITAIGNKTRKGYKVKKKNKRLYFYTGVQLLEQDCFNYIPEGNKESLTNVLFYKWLEEDVPFYGFIHDGIWSDIGTPQSYLKLNFKINKGKKLLDYSDGAKVNKGVKVNNVICLRKSVIRENLKKKIIINSEVSYDKSESIII